MADETSATSVASGAPRPGYRGKCLYKTGKCNNERALKTSGQSHNLCDEHRHRQNEHQRKLDAKNRFARKDKRAAAAKGDSPTSSALAAARAAHGHRYVPYGKVRVSPTGASAVDDVHAILGRNGIVAQPMMQFHALGLDGANAMAAASQLAANGGTPVAGGAPEILPSGVVILPNGPQAPQMPYPSAMQDFDGIVVPLPSYLEGHERVEFRSRIYQKVLDFIAEECMRRFGAVGPAGGAAPPMQPVMANATNGTAAAAAATTSAKEEIPSAATSSPAPTAATTATTTAPTGDDAKTASSSQANSPDSQETASEKLTDHEKNDGEDAQPEDADDAPAGDDGEGEETPRSKRATRSRGVRKESQTI